MSRLPWSPLRYRLAAFGALHHHCCVTPAITVPLGQRRWPTSREGEAGMQQGRLASALTCRRNRHRGRRTLRCSCSPSPCL